MKQSMKKVMQRIYDNSSNPTRRALYQGLLSAFRNRTLQLLPSTYVKLEQSKAHRQKFFFDHVDKFLGTAFKNRPIPSNVFRLSQEIKNPSESFAQSRRRFDCAMQSSNNNIESDIDLCYSVNYYNEHGKLPPNAYVENLKKHRNRNVR